MAERPGPSAASNRRAGPGLRQPPEDLGQHQSVIIELLALVIELLALLTKGYLDPVEPLALLIEGQLDPVEPLALVAEPFADIVVEHAQAETDRIDLLGQDVAHLLLKLGHPRFERRIVR